MSLFLVLKSSLVILMVVSAQLTTDDTTNSTAPTQQDDFEAEPVPDGPYPEVVLESEAGSGIGQTNKNIPVTLLDKILRPLNDKLAKLNQLLLLAKHPNFGGVQLLSPQYLWEKLHELKPHFLTGPYGAAIGLGHRPQVDYPFAYRRTRSISQQPY